jgi:hypothetical protein
LLPFPHAINSKPGLQQFFTRNRIKEVCVCVQHCVLLFLEANLCKKLFFLLLVLPVFFEVENCLFLFFLHLEKTLLLEALFKPRNALPQAHKSRLSSE